MFLYTFIMEYERGTYISQFSGKTVKDACGKWVKNLNVSKIESFTEANKLDFIKEMKVEKPVSVSNVINVWCVSLLNEDDKLALINVIQTDNTDN